MPRRPFIDRKRAVHFDLVHRSQRDAAILDEDAPDRVLKLRGGMGAAAAGSETQSVADDVSLFENPFPNDGYNYDQHLRTIGGGVYVPAATPRERLEGLGIVLPKEVFASDRQDEVGLLNRAAPQGLRLDVDPDIIAALENPDECDSDLEDDFVALASGKGGRAAGAAGPASADSDGSGEHQAGSDDEYSTYSGSGGDSDSGGDDGGGVGGGRARGARRSSRHDDLRSFVTNDTHPGTASVIDERFERVMEEYSSDEVGSIADDEEARGALSLSQFEHLLTERDEQQSAFLQRTGAEYARVPAARHGGDAELAALADDAADAAGSDRSEEFERVYLPERGPVDDIESVHSVSSTAYQPAVIREESVPRRIQLSAKTGIPLAVLPGPTKAPRATGENLGRARPREETAEERRARKAALKSERRERREEKKQQKVAHKAEDLRQSALAAQQPLRGRSVFPVS